MLLRGPKLALFLKSTTEKGLVITLVHDCCFLAGLYRNCNTGDDMRFLPDDFPGNFDPSTYSKDCAVDPTDNRPVQKTVAGPCGTIGS